MENNITQLLDNIVIQDTTNGSFYCRSMSKQSQILCTMLETCYPCKQSKPKAIITPSGMSSIAVCLESLLSENKGENINIIRGDELYCDTPRLIKFLSKKHNFCEYVFNVNNIGNPLNDIFDTKATNQINILFIESATNPSGDIFDFTMIPVLRKKSKRLYVIVDNTWINNIAIYCFVKF